MPIHNFNQTKDSHPANPNIQPPVYQSVTVDSKRQDLRHLITHIEGMKWVLPYYFSQYLAQDDEVSAHELTREDVYQQYLCIKDLEVRVTTPLSPTQNDQSKEFTMEGTSSLFPGLVPNAGDAFIADIGDGRAGIFNVKTVQRKAILQDSSYEITYEFIDVCTPARLQDLLEKAIKTQTFVKEFIHNGQNPYLVDSELDIYKQIMHYSQILPDMYYDMFFDQEYGTLLVPDQDISMYDPYVVSFFKSIIPLDRHPRVTNIRALQCDTSKSRTVRTIYDALLKCDENVLDTASLKSKRYYAKTFNNSPQFGGVRYSGIDQVYYTGFNEDTVARPVGLPLKPSKPRQFNRPIPLSQYLAVNVLPPNIDASIPTYHPVTLDDYYVLSHFFYERADTGMSHLEIMVKQRLNNTPNNLQLLIQLVDQAEVWGKVEQYYYYPILMYLLLLAPMDVN